MAENNSDPRNKIVDLSQTAMYIPNMWGRPKRPEKGDVNKDGRVNVIDTLLLKEYLEFTNTRRIDKREADINGTNSIGWEDYRLLSMKTGFVLRINGTFSHQGTKTIQFTKANYKDLESNIASTITSTDYEFTIPANTDSLIKAVPVLYATINLYGTYYHYLNGDFTGVDYTSFIVPEGPDLIYGNSLNNTVIRNITLPKSLKGVYSINTVYMACKFILEKLDFIGGGSFGASRFLEDVYINSVTNITDESFGNVKFIKNVTVLDIEAIGPSCFQGAKFDSNLNIRDVNTISNGCFTKASNITTDFNGVLNIENVKTITNGCFGDNYAYDDVNISGCEHIKGSSWCRTTINGNLNIKNVDDMSETAFASALLNGKLNIENCNLSAGAFSAAKINGDIYTKNSKYFGGGMPGIFASDYVNGDLSTLKYNITCEDCDVSQAAFTGSAFNKIVLNDCKLATNCFDQIYSNEVFVNDCTLSLNGVGSFNWSYSCYNNPDGRISDDFKAKLSIVNCDIEYDSLYGNNIFDNISSSKYSAFDDIYIDNLKMNSNDWGFTHCFRRNLTCKNSELYNAFLTNQVGSDSMATNLTIENSKIEDCFTGAKTLYYNNISLKNTDVTNCFLGISVRGTLTVDGGTFVSNSTSYPRGIITNSPWFRMGSYSSVDALITFKNCNLGTIFSTYDLKCDGTSAKIQNITFENCVLSNLNKLKVGLNYVVNLTLDGKDIHPTLTRDSWAFHKINILTVNKNANIKSTGSSGYYHIINVLKIGKDQTEKPVDTTGNVVRIAKMEFDLQWNQSTLFSLNNLEQTYDVTVTSSLKYYFIRIPDCVTRLTAEATTGTSLKSKFLYLYFGSNLESIPSNVFDNTNIAACIFIGNTPPVVEDNGTQLYKYTNSTKIFVPDNSIDAYTTALSNISSSAIIALSELDTNPAYSSIKQILDNG